MVRETTKQYGMQFLPLVRLIRLCRALMLCTLATQLIASRPLGAQTHSNGYWVAEDGLVFAINKEGNHTRLTGRLNSVDLAHQTLTVKGREVSVVGQASPRGVLAEDGKTIRWNSAGDASPSRDVKGVWKRLLPVPLEVEGRHVVLFPQIGVRDRWLFVPDPAKPVVATTDGQTWPRLSLLMRHDRVRRATTPICELCFAIPVRDEGLTPDAVLAAFRRARILSPSTRVSPLPATDYTIEMTEPPLEIRPRTTGALAHRAVARFAATIPGDRIDDVRRAVLDAGIACNVRYTYRHPTDESFPIHAHFKTRMSLAEYSQVIKQTLVRIAPPEPASATALTFSSVRLPDLDREARLLGLVALEVTPALVIQPRETRAGRQRGPLLIRQLSAELANPSVRAKDAANEEWLLRPQRVVREKSEQSTGGGRLRLVFPTLRWQKDRGWGQSQIQVAHLHVPGDQATMNKLGADMEHVFCELVFVQRAFHRDGHSIEFVQSGMNGLLVHRLESPRTQIDVVRIDPSFLTWDVSREKRRSVKEVVVTMEQGKRSSDPAHFGVRRFRRAVKPTVDAAGALRPPSRPIAWLVRKPTRFGKPIIAARVEFVLSDDTRRTRTYPNLHAETGRGLVLELFDSDWKSE